MWEKFDWTAKLGLTRGKVRSGRRDGPTQAFLRLGPRLISLLFSNIIPVIILCRSIHLMLLLIPAYLPNILLDVTQMSHSTIGCVGNFYQLIYISEYSIVLSTCWSKLGFWLKVFVM